MYVSLYSQSLNDEKLSNKVSHGLNNNSPNVGSLNCCSCITTTASLPWTSNIIDCSLAVVGWPADAYSHGTACGGHGAAHHYTGPACSAKVHFILVSVITNAVNKTSGPGQLVVYFFRFCGPY